MKYTILLSFLIGMSLQGVFAQKKKPEPTKTIETPAKTVETVSNTPKKDTIDYDLRVYANSISIGDYNTAIMAMHYKYAKDSNIKWLDTLSKLYYTGGNSRAAILTGELVIKRQPNNITILELLAVSYDNLNDKKTALTYYEKLVEKTQKPYFSYQCAVQEFALGRVSECELNLKKTMAHPECEKEKINMVVSQNQTQMVVLKAACLNLLGFLQMKLNKNEEAKKSFEDALKISPDFALAKGNLEYLTKPKDKK